MTLRTTSGELAVVKETAASFKTTNTTLSKQAATLHKENEALRLAQLKSEKESEAKWVSE